MRPSYLILRCACLALCVAGFSQAASESPSLDRQPVYFQLSHHQEAVGPPCHGFPNYGRFKENLRHELELLDRYGVVSDQCFSDFIVSVVLYMRDTGRDPDAEDIFRWFNQSRQNLGYHFHPTTWDVGIRLEKIKDMEDLDAAIAEYEKWEQAYYDWSTCVESSGDGTTFCGTLDPNRLGGVRLMQQYFQRPLVNECLTILNPAAGQVFRQKYGQICPVVGQSGNPHSYYTTGLYQYLWQSDWMFSSEPGIYVYKMMGLYFVQTRSAAWIERLAPVSAFRQALVGLPRDIPHFFHIHLTIPDPNHDPLEGHLEYLTKEFLPANPGSRFISTADIPNLVILNPRQFSMTDLEEASRFVLYRWHGRPSAFAKYGDRYMSLASLFKGLQAALQAYLAPSLGPQVWPQTVSVADFIRPPLGRESAVPKDIRLAQGFPMASMMAAVKALDGEDAIPYCVAIPVLGEGQDLPLQANAAEFLSGMCTLFLRLREGEASGQVQILPAHIVPISNLPGEVARQSNQTAKTNMDWIGELQLWTLEPLQLKGLLGTRDR